MTEETDIEELVDSFSQSVGVEKARDIVESTADRIGLGDRDSFDREDVVELCEAIQRDHEGYIGIVAHELQIRKAAGRRVGALLENIPDPAIVSQFHEDGHTIRSVNSAFEQVFGYEEETLVGESLNDYIVPEDLTDESMDIEQSVRAGEQIEYEVKRETADGELRDFLLRGVPIRTETNEIEAYGIYTDITEQKRRERELRRKNDQLEQFASVVSHDLRNPLNVLKGRVEIAMKECDCDQLEEIETVTERMETLVDDLLALARQGQTIGDTEPVDLENLAVRAWSNVAAPDATIAFEDLGAVEADPRRLVELLENLFRNAVEHGSTGSQNARRSADAVEHGSANSRSGTDDAVDHGGVTITVEMREDGFAVGDDGPGIPPEERDEVLDHGYTTADQGTGYGLSIVRSIVEAHDWSLRITDHETGGACFEVGNVQRP
jgi:PAS domain S-box-containing protein